ncbi:patatin-like phospholipase family protein [Massilia arenosa]|uniref:Patatin-like phospholipase family protein n=1 Tax=Zemynaea arenosa TaxID=2561931 RepID=A0A4Y9SI81_9BURK|nr:patatin-like phospholipase family protein [Massilia arenosa]TFW25055.1 patatin-like phospholipase family protein [Massilia arenosa]
MNALEFHAGPRALEHIRQHGLRARDVAVIPAAAGGPKGLIFQALDQWLFSEWLPAAPRERTLIGSSIGAWRMAAACQRDPVAAFKRLGDLYAGQRYDDPKPTPRQIDDVCRKLLADFVTGHEEDILAHPHYRMHLLTDRGRGALAAPRHRKDEMRGFASAALRNIAARAHLAPLLERVVMGDVRDPLPWLREPWDVFTTHFVRLTPRNLPDALLASGTLPLIMQAIQHLDEAPPGSYWDGGILDYHLALPYARLHSDDLVLYPHFTSGIVPGWLDKSLPWRRAHKGPNRGWLDNVLVVAPSRKFLRTLPRGKLPDRKDFQHYGLDHDERIRQWQKAISQAQALRDDFAAFAERPDIARIRAM